MTRWLVMLLAVLFWGARLAEAQGRFDRRPLPAGAQSAALAAIAQEYPCLASALRESLERSGEGIEPRVIKALKTIAAFAGSRNSDVRLAMKIMDSALPPTRQPVPNIKVDGRAEDWAQVSSAPLKPDTQGTTGAGHLEDLRAAIGPGQGRSKDKWLFIMFKPKDVGFLKQPGSVFNLDIDLVDTPGYDLRLSLTQESSAPRIMLERWPLQKGTSAALSEARAATGEVIELGIPLAALHRHAQGSPHPDLKPYVSLCGQARFTDGSSKKVLSSSSRRFFVRYAEAPPDYYARPYAEALLNLAADEDLRPDDSLALAIAIEAAFFHFMGDDEVRRELRSETAAMLRLAHQIDAWQRGLGMKDTLATLPLEAKLAWAYRGAARPECRFFSIWSAGQRNKMEYDWFATKPATLQRMRELALKEGLVSSSVKDTARKIEKWIQSKLKYRQELEVMKKRVADGTLKEGTYLEAKEEAEKGQDFFCMFGDKKVYCRYLFSANKHLELYQQRGHFYGACGEETTVCNAFLRSVGIAPFRFYRNYSREEGVDHAWPGYYDPVEQKWRSLQRHKPNEKFIYFAFHRFPVYIDSYCLPRLYPEPDRLPDARFYALWELTFADLSARLKAGFDREMVRDFLLARVQCAAVPPWREVEAPKVKNEDHERDE